MNKKQFYDILSNASLLNENTINEISEIVAEYPFFQMGWIFLLKNLHNIDSIKFQSELRKASIHVNCRDTLYKIINQKLKEKKPIIHATDNVATATNNDYFSNVPDEISYKQKPIYELTDDTVSTTKAEYTTDETTQHKRNLIDTFLSQGEHRITPINIEQQPKTTNENKAEFSDRENDDILTETLASIYIKQKQYAKAITIFKKLILKNPEKSIYFASRIKELENLNV